MTDPKSHWETSKAKSVYHFDPREMDPRWDTIQGIGRFSGDWSESLRRAIADAEPVSWRTRKFSPIPGKEVSPSIEREEYDLERAGIHKDAKIFRVIDELYPEFQAMVDRIGLANVTTRFHVQFPGEVFTMHIDQLAENRRAPPENIIRVGVMLTDWRPGHFYQYGNYTYEKWRRGDIHTFDWPNVPHCTANASLEPRVSMLVTGVTTPEYREFLKAARKTPTIEI